jgi:hypothetical protein
LILLMMNFIMKNDGNCFWVTLKPLKPKQVDLITEF